MPNQPNDSLEALLLRRASSIGAQPLPPLTQEAMPFSPWKGAAFWQAGKSALEEVPKEFDPIRSLLDVGTHNAVGYIGNKMKHGLEDALGQRFPDSFAGWYDLMLGRDKAAAEAKPPAGTYPIATGKFEPRDY